jgi:endonuclease YncB( thermonuclease family)
MPIARIFSFVLFLFPVCAFAGSPLPNLDADGAVKITSVVDGDTFVADILGRDTKLRLYGIDAPELNQEYGHEAKAYLESVMQSPTLKIKLIKLDRYGRLAASVKYAPGRMPLEWALVTLGYAWVYPDHCRTEPKCEVMKEVENRARAEKRGLWAKEAVPPWEWREGKRAGD